MRRILPLCLLAALMGCGAHAIDADSVVCVQVPAGAAAFAPLALDPDLRYPIGARLVLIERPEPALAGAVLTPDFATAGFPCLSFDATRLLFAARREAGAPWAIYEVALRSGKWRVVRSADHGCYAPAYLAGERVVYVADARDGTSDLYTCAADGSGVERITHHRARVLDPTALADGRVLYVLLDRGAGGAARTRLMTVQADGTLVRAATRAGGWQLCRPRAVSGSEVALVADGRVALTSLAREDDPCPSGTLAVASVGCWDVRRFLVAACASGTAAPHQLLLLDAARGEVDGVLGASGMPLIDAERVQPRAPPRTHVSTIDRGRDAGELLCLDASRAEPQLPRAAQWVRVSTCAGASLAPQVLGEAPLAADGSLFIQVPADQPLRLELLDAERAAVGSACAWIWVRPGERRGCVGCHESRALAPRNRTPLAVRTGALPLAAPQLAARDVLPDHE